MTAMVMNGQVKQTYLTLNNGVQMPQFGLGVYSIPDFIRPPGQGSTFFVLILLVILIILLHFNTLLKRCKIIKNGLIKPEVFRFIVPFAQKKG